MLAYNGVVDNQRSGERRATTVKKSVPMALRADNQSGG